ncbi:caspase family protein [Roseibium album]|uniref:caspase family protein n=1 Tax=Roseibium album TaxID=311410 RepID=UPI003297E608
MAKESWLVRSYRFYGSASRRGVLGRISLATLGFMICFASAQSNASERIALVFGNSAYGEFNELPNPVNDAQLMSNALKNVGFTTIDSTNANREEMISVFKEFSDRIDEDSEVVFYYAGHGVQFFSENYLIPINSNLNTTQDLPFEAFNLDNVFKILSQKKPKTAVIILDACRNNPLEVGVNLEGDTNVGLARATGPVGTFIAYATEPGGIAADGAGLNSPFTAAIADFITQPGLPLEQVFKRVRERVVETTDGYQVPWDNSSLIQDFFFREALAADSSPVAVVAEDVEFWRSATRTDTRQAYEQYVDDWPDGMFVDLANRRMQELTVLASAQTTGEGAARNLGTASDVESWNVASFEGTADSYQRYLVAFPEGMFARLAKLRLERVSGTGVKDIGAVSSVITPNFKEFEDNPLYPPVTECDYLAGHVQEAADPAVGVFFHEIEPQGALAVCLDALKEYPDSLRLLMNYARAIDAAGRHDEAREMYKSGAAAGFPIAYRSLGDVYRDGRGLEKNLDEARYWYVLGAEKFNVFAEFNLALIYENGLGVEVDREKAAYWLWRAARQGFSAAMEKLAVYYLEGDVIDQNYNQAVLLLTGASQMGHMWAQQRLGEMFLDGRGVDQDNETGKNWLEQSSAQGNPWAQAKLGQLFRDGVGTSKDLEKALMWLTIAEKGGAGYAAELSSQVSNELDEARKKRAYAAADSFVAKRVK